MKIIALGLAFTALVALEVGNAQPQQSAPSAIASHPRLCGQDSDCYCLMQIPSVVGMSVEDAKVKLMAALRKDPPPNYRRLPIRFKTGTPVHDVRIKAGLVASQNPWPYGTSSIEVCAPVGQDVPVESVIWLTASKGPEKATCVSTPAPNLYDQPVANVRKKFPNTIVVREFESLNNLQEVEHVPVRYQWPPAGEEIYPDQKIAVLIDTVTPRVVDTTDPETSTAGAAGAGALGGMAAGELFRRARRRKSPAEAPKAAQVATGPKPEPASVRIRVDRP